MSEPLFQSHGHMSAKEAAMLVIRGIEPRNGITVAQAVDEVAELTGFPHAEATVRSAMRDASDALIAGGEKGLVARPGFGWERLDDEGLIRKADTHADKARRQIVRSMNGAQAADPEALGWEDRQRRDFRISVGRASLELTVQRSRRRRPIDPPMT